MKPKKLIVPTIALAAALAFLIPFMNRALSVAEPKSQEPSHDQVFSKKFTEYVNTEWDKIKESPVLPPNMTKDQYISRSLKVFNTQWFIDILHYDPAPVLEKVDCPVLALIGEKDVQVPPQENLRGISDALARGGNINVAVKEVPGLNHLFQECETGAVSEYASIEQTFSPIALEEISEWVLAQVK